MNPNLVVTTVVTLFAVALAVDNFAFTDKVGQGNFAFAKLFAYGDDGNFYQITKRSAEEPSQDRFAFTGPRSKFAKHRNGQLNDFAFAFAKRSPNQFAFAKFNGDSANLIDNNEGPGFAKFAKRSDDDSSFAKFAKR